jgi:uncharacterized membrane protein YcaP (DUF421 family)
MTGFEAPDWAGMWVPDASLVESFLRGTAIYFAILVIFRVIPRRQTGAIGLPDIMLVVLVADCVSNALNMQAKSILNALVAVFTLVFWAFLIDRVEYHWPPLRRWLEPEPLELVRDGKKVEENLRQEQLTDEELAEQLRLNGVEDVSRVKLAVMESSGNVSVIPKEEPVSPPPVAPVCVPPADFDAAMRQFLLAAQALRTAADEHEIRAGKHRKAAREARGLLSRYGVRGRKFLEALAEDPQPANGQAGKGARD